MPLSNARVSVIALMTLLVSSLTAAAEPSRSQTQDYIAEKTQTSWEAGRSPRNHLIQTVSFPSECEMQITTRAVRDTDHSAVVAESVAQIPFGDIYKMVSSNRGILLGTRADTIRHTWVYFPAHSDFSNFCSSSETSCRGRDTTRDEITLNVVHPVEEYRQRVGRAINRMKDLCGEKELF